MYARLAGGDYIQISPWMLMALRRTGGNVVVDLLMLCVYAAKVKQREWKWERFAEVGRKIGLKIEDRFENLSWDILIPTEGISKMCQHRLANFADTLFSFVLILRTFLCQIDSGLAYNKGAVEVRMSKIS